MDIILNNVKYLALRILDSENDEIARQMQKYCILMSFIISIVV